MKKIIAILILLFTTIELYSDTPTKIIYGHRHEEGQAGGINVITCRGPFDVKCETCKQATIPTNNYTNIAKFYHSDVNPEVGVGYTDINIYVDIEPETGYIRDTIILLNSSNQTFTSFSEWKTAVGL